jgi:hypothetical protein
MMTSPYTLQHKHLGYSNPRAKTAAQVRPPTASQFGKPLIEIAISPKNAWANARARRKLAILYPNNFNVLADI